MYALPLIVISASPSSSVVARILLHPRRSAPAASSDASRIRAREVGGDVDAAGAGVARDARIRTEGPRALDLVPLDAHRRDGVRRQAALDPVDQAGHRV